MALWRRFGGAQPPTYSPRKEFQDQYDHAKRHKGRVASSVLRPPRPLATPSGSPQRNGQTRSEPAKADNRADITRTHYWRSRPGGTGTQAIASRLFFLREEKDRREPNAKRRDQRALRTSDKALKEKRSRRSLSPAAGIRRTYIKPPIPESCTLPRRVTALFRAIRGATGGRGKNRNFFEKRY